MEMSCEIRRVSFSSIAVSGNATFIAFGEIFIAIAANNSAIVINSLIWSDAYLCDMDQISFWGAVKFSDY